MYIHVYAYIYVCKGVGRDQMGSERAPHQEKVRTVDTSTYEKTVQSGLDNQAYVVGYFSWLSGEKKGEEIYVYNYIYICIYI
jgi:hypothetical protein